MKHRNRLEIIALILQNAVETNGATQKRIMYKAYLSYHHLKSTWYYYVKMSYYSMMNFDELIRLQKKENVSSIFIMD